MLKYFKEKGLENISITDCFSQYQKRVLEELKILNYIKKIYGFNDSYLKNSIGKVIQMQKILELQCKRDEFVMIGDSLSNDIFLQIK